MRKLFRSSHTEIWRQLADELGARHVAGGTRKVDRGQVEHGEWAVTLDGLTVMAAKVPIVYTRFRAPCVNPDGFRFSAYRRSFVSDIATWFGLQDIVVGHAAFDRDFVLEGTDEAKRKRLFDDAGICRLGAAYEDDAGVEL